MIIIYIILLAILILIAWLVVRRKWKGLLWTVLILIVLAVSGWYLFLHIISRAFGTECEDNREWKIEEYVIIEKRCIGFAVPPYYPVLLYKNGKEISRLSAISDSSCDIRFNSEIEGTLTFDICEKTITNHRQP